MKHAKHRHEVRLVGTARRNRRSLLVSTALQAAFLAVISLPASAQPAPGARPTGGSVVGGAAAISQSGSNTLIAQSTQRAAINWRSFDVGSQQSVTFQQPSASSIALNRVVGPDPSQIAGRITANGQIVISNQSGVLFYKGSQVDTAGLIATSANITNKNFMSGNMVFDQAGKPNAQVVNEGTLTARQAGLVGLVAPRVANSGVIEAKLGHVVLAGAPTATLDMYGDGMLSIDVTDKVRQVPVGRDGKPVAALVTNSGTIIAEGGTVRLTAAAADGIVQTLVDAGGKIAARGGRVEIAGTGGSVQVDGDVIVNGRGPAGTGGQIAINATDTVTIARGATLSANGAAGGGTVAIGTTIARATGGPSVASASTAKTVWVQQGATIRADATRRGRGGTVVLLSSNHTEHAGTITARGGTLGGDGGTVEISGATVGLTGGVDVSAPHGTMGTILLDPVDVVIGPQGGGAPVAVNPTADPSVPFDTTPGTGTITPASLQALTGNVHVEATNNITVNAPVTLSAPNQNFTLEAGNNITVNAGLSTTGSLNLIAASTNSPAPVLSGSVTIGAQGVLNAGGNITLLGGTGTLSFAGTASAGATGTISLLGDRISLPGTIFGGPLFTASSLVLAPASAGRAIEVIASGTANPNALSLAATVLSQIANVATLDLGQPSATPTAGGINLGNSGDFVDLRNINRSGPQGSILPSTLGLYSGAAVTQGGSLAVGTLQGTAAFVTLTALPSAGSGVSGNQITALGAFNNTAGNFALYDAVPLTVTGTVSVPGGNPFTGKVITLADNTIAIAPGGFLLADGGAVEFTPITSGTNIEVIASGTATPGALSLSTAELSQYKAFDLFLGPVDGTPISAGNLRLGNAGDNVTLGSAPVLVFQSSGSVTQNGSLTVSTITGNASSVSLPNPSNSVQVIGNIQSPNGFALTTATNLQVVNSLNATNGGITLDAGGNLVLYSAGTLPPPPTVLNGGTSAFAVGISLTAGGSITDTPSSILNTNILQASGTAVTLTGTANAVSALLLSQATAGDFALTDSIPLTVGSNLTVPSGHTITLTDDTIAINNGPQGFGTPTISAPNGLVILAPLSADRPEELIASAGAAASGSLSLTTADIAHVNAGTLQLGSATTGPIKLGNAGDPLNLSASVGALVLQAGTLGDVTEGGTLTVGTLSGSTRSAALTGGNTIGTLGGFSVQNGFTLADQSGLNVVGAVTDAGASSQTTITATGALAVSSNITSNAQVQLAASGGDLTQTAGTISAPVVSLASSIDVVQSGAASISTGTLIASATGPTGSVLLPGAGNAITGTGALLANGTIGIADSTGLTVAGTISAATVSLDVTGALALNAGLTSTNATMIARGAGGVISENAGGTLTVNNLLDGSAVQATFGNGSVNHVAALGSFSTTTGFDLVATNPSFGGMTVNGPVTDATSVDLHALGALVVAGTISAPSVSLTSDRGPQGLLVPGDITLTGLVSAPNTVTLVAGGAISQGITAGAIVGSPTLTGSAGGTVALQNPLNTIGTLGSFSSAGGFALTNSQGLIQSGALSDTVSIGLTTTAGDLQLGGTVAAPSVALSAAGSIVEPGGAITTSTGDLTATAATGSVDLPSAQNVIPTLAGGASGTSFNVTDSNATLNITGPVTAGPASSITVTDDAPSFGPQGALIAPGGVVTLRPFASTTFTVGGGGGISGTPSVTANTLIIGSDTASTVTIAGAFNLSTVNGLDLVSNDVVTESGGGAINIGTLSVQGKTITLGGANTVQTLAGAYYQPPTGPIAPADTFALTNSGNLAITGLVSATAATLSNPTGSITESGTLSVGTLSGSATSAQLTGTNAVDTLGIFSTSSGFILIDGSALTVAGPVSGGTVTLSSAGTLAIPGTISAGGGTVSLTASGALTETGAITAGTLTGGAASATLNGSSGIANQVTTLGSFATTTGFALVDGGPLTVVGPVSDNASVAIGSLGSLSLAGSISAPVIALTAANAGTISPGNIVQTAGTIAGATAVTLNAGGFIAQTGGAVTGGTLTGSAGGTVSLGGTSNSLTALGAFTSVGGFTLNDGLGAGATLVQSGTVSDSLGGITLSANAGSLALGGTLVAPSVALTADAGITQTGGGILATTLTASSASGAVTLGQTANAVDTLDTSGAAGAFSLTDKSALTIAGTIFASGSAPTITLADDAPSFGPQGALIAAGGTVALGPYTPNSLFTVGSGGVIGGSSNVTAATLTVGSGIAGTVLVTGPLDLTGVPALDLVSGGAVGETGAGSVSVGTLNASGSSIALTGANTIGVLGNISTPGAFAFSDTGFNVAGAVSAGSATLTSSGGITESGSIATAALTVGSGGPVTLSGSNAVASLVSLSSTGGFSLTDTVPLTVNGTDQDNTGIALQTTGSLVVGGTLTAPSVNLVAGGPITEVAQGGTNAPGLIVATLLTGSGAGVTLGQANQVNSLGTFNSSGDFLLADASSLNVTGAVLAAPGHTLTIASDATTFGSGGTLTAQNGVVALTPFTAGGTLSVGGGTSIGGTPAVNAGTLVLGSSSTGALLVTGAVNVTGAATLDLISGGDVTETGSGAIAAGVLIGSAGNGFNLGGANQIGTLGAVSAGNGQNINIYDTAPITLAGTITAPNAQILFRDDTITVAPGALFNVGSAVANTSAGVTNAVFFSPYASNGPLTLSGGNGVAGAPVTIAPFVSIGSSAITNGGGTVLASNVTINGGFNLGAAALRLTATNSVSETSTGAIAAGTLISGGVNGLVNFGGSGTVSLTGANAFANLGAYNSGSGFTLNNAQSLAVVGPVMDGTAINLTAAGSLALGGTLKAPVVNLVANGDITQNAGTIGAGTLTGSANGNVGLTQLNSIDTLGSFASHGNFTLSDTAPLAIGGAVSARLPGTSLTIADNTVLFGSGNLASDGSVTLQPLTQTQSGAAPSFTVGGGSGTAGASLVSGNGLTLGAAGVPTTIGGALNLTGAGPVSVIGSAITETGPGALAATTLSLAAPSSTVRLGGPNTIGTLAGAAGLSAFQLNEVGNLAINGNVSATTATLTASGQITQVAGTFSAGTLTGSAAGSAQFGPSASGPVAQVGTLGQFTVTNLGTLKLSDSIPLTIAGPVSAAQIAISAPSSITVNGGSIVTNGLGIAQQSGPQGPLQGSYLLVTPANGTGTGQFSQLGTTRIAGLSGTTSTLRIQVPDGGAISLNNLVGTGTNLILGTGTGGRATGTLAVGGLLVVGQGGGAALSGSVAGQTGSAAAQSSFITPAPDVNYQLNGCEISSVNCSIVSSPNQPQIPGLPSDLPASLIAELAPKSFLPSIYLITLNLLTLAIAPDPNDPDLLLPNISAQDY